MINDDKKDLLLLDNFRGHSINENEFPFISFQFLPASTTSLTQPLDGGIIRSFKSKYLHFFLKHLLDNIDSGHVSDITKDINLLTSLNWIDASWKHVSSQVYC